MNHSAALKLSLLAALGIVSAACGGTATSSNDDTKGGAGNTTTGGGGATTTVGGGTVLGTPPKCTNPTPLPASGFVKCDEGYVHRTEAVTCLLASSNGAAPDPQGGAASDIAAPDPQGGAASDVAAPAPATLPRVPLGEPIHCSADPSICNAYQYGYCMPGPFMGGGVDNSTCLSGCLVDADCGSGYMCSCDAAGSPHGGVCTPTGCQTDADCETGYRCASYRGGCGGDGFACQTSKDTCRYETCNGTLQSCHPVGAEDGHQECAPVSVCGRPFLINAAARVAPVAANADWSRLAEWTPALDHLTTSERAALAQHWTKLGQMEHASIAAFARFSLQLLALGAPPELVEACTQALADETAHTKLCFALASAYAGRAIGPGPLDVSGSLEVTSLADIVDLVVAEGCFGETSAALEALEAADTASDPVIVAAYSQIAKDEQRHAELAFRFVRWALAQDPEAIRPRLVHAVAEQTHPSLAVQDVVEPCLCAVLAA